MESEPVEVDEDSITTLQVRTLENKNRMKMVSTLFLTLTLLVDLLFIIYIAVVGMAWLQ